ncbi:flagellin N-terminal helical domain-containing protein [Devosia sp. A16]|uniref:flagellin N-terminal helical domain-containing protein n=1 Tax=Devosia sp. A16 TaxID=1736675 RepID=UPI0006D81682|nr:flagellin [Devosia sp. A16]
MADVNLSKAVRSNLLALQSTAASMAKTQQRLATGLKVNSALDNPTNFFTAASLNSRAGDMSNLLDSMSNGIKTIEAADNGLSAITKTVESMQSTLRQARQDKSFKTQSFTLDPARTGLLEFTGGAVGGAAVGVSLGSAAAVQSTFAASADFTAPGDGSVSFAYAPSGGTTFGASDEITFQLDQTGPFAVSWNVSISLANLPGYGNGDNTIDDIDEFTDILHGTLLADGYATSVTNDGTNIIIATTAGPGSKLTIGAVNGDVDGGGSINSTFGMAPVAGNPSAPITISNGTTTASINLTSANAATIGQARSYIQSELSAQGVTGITVGGSGNRMDLQGAADGSNTVTVGGAGAAAIFGTSGTQTAGATAGSYPVDQLVQSINSNSGLKDRIRASNDNGKLRIENLSTEELTVHGVGSDGEIDGTSGTADIGGNEVRKNLVKQFNELRDQLDKLADDASFNGINLLRGDNLKLTFNETGTSTIDIQARDADGDPTSINNATLDIASAVFADFDSDAALDARLGKLGEALGKLRSQASAFGSNLSIVENRNDFTKSMINTLETGAANLTLADANQEAANLLALQTRQQLSSTALSMASQADQAVLRLF